MGSTAEEFDLRIHFPHLRLKGIHDALDNILGRLNTMAVDQATLDQKLGDLKTSVDALVALVQTPPASVDLQAEADQVDALKASVDAAVASAQPPAA